MLLTPLIRIATVLALVLPAAPAQASSYYCSTMQIVAHEDDDLLFMNPRVSEDIRAGRCTVTVFVTAGDAGRGYAYWSRREQGPLAAYARMRGLVGHSWEHTIVTINGHPVNKYRLRDTAITLYFLRLPDGHCGWSITHYECLDRLWSGQLATIHSLDGKTSYTLSSLRQTLLTVMRLHRPTYIRVHDFSGALQNPPVLASGDHSNHIVVANLAYQASLSYTSFHHIIGFEGYSADSKPANLPLAVRQDKAKTFLAYAQYDSRTCQTAATCLASTTIAARLSHVYVVLAR